MNNPQLSKPVALAPLNSVETTILGAGLNLYTGGAAAPWIAGANNFIQNLPDNSLTR